MTVTSSIIEMRVLFTVVVRLTGRMTGLGLDILTDFHILKIIGSALEPIIISRFIASIILPLAAFFF